MNLFPCRMARMAWSKTSSASCLRMNPSTPGDALLNKLFFLVHGENQYANMWINFFDFTGCLQAPEIRHGNIENNHIGVGLYTGVATIPGRRRPAR